MKSKVLLIGLITMAFAFSTQGQGLVGKLKQKAEEAAEKALEKKAKEKAGVNTGNDPSGSGGSGSSSVSGNPSNKGGGGLVTAPPDVKANLADAETAYKSASYGDARYAVQQAMLGVEMEIGNKVLNSLPQTVSGLPYEKESDQVTSTGYGWAGLTIQRQYQKYCTLKISSMKSLFLAFILVSSLNLNLVYAQSDSIRYEKPNTKYFLKHQLLFG